MTRKPKLTIDEMRALLAVARSFRQENNLAQTEKSLAASIPRPWKHREHSSREILLAAENKLLLSIDLSTKNTGPKKTKYYAPGFYGGDPEGELSQEFIAELSQSHHPDPYE